LENVCTRGYDLLRKVWDAKIRTLLTVALYVQFELVLGTALRDSLFDNKDERRTYGTKRDYNYGRRMTPVYVMLINLRVL
jgi:hypothetical protein